MENSSNLDVVAFGVLESSETTPVYFVENEVRAMGKTRQHVDMTLPQQLRDQALDSAVVDSEMREFSLHPRRVRHRVMAEEVDDGKEW